jgi:hypothetical protein
MLDRQAEISNLARQSFSGRVKMTLHHSGRGRRNRGGLRWRPTRQVYVYARGPAERVKVLAYAEDTVPRLGMLCLWNGQPLTAKAVFMFRFTAMSGRGMCNRRECAAPLCRPLFRARCNGWRDGK